VAEKPKREKVTQLPLIVDCQASTSGNPALVAPDVFPILTARLVSLGGEVYQMPLSIRAASGLLLALAGWEPLCEAMKESEDHKRPKSQ
jgi:hypothetical protein